MTIEEYLRFKAIPVTDRSYKDCVEADKLIKEVALSNFRKHISTFAMADELKEFVITAMKYFYGSGEADHVLTVLGCYLLSQ